MRAELALIAVIERLSVPVVPGVKRRLATPRLATTTGTVRDRSAVGNAGERNHSGSRNRQGGARDKPDGDTPTRTTYEAAEYLAGDLSAFVSGQHLLVSEGGPA